MISFLKTINNWFRNLILPNVDKPLKDYIGSGMNRGFRSKKDPVEQIEKRFDEQKSMN
ncbi:MULTISPECIES: hypothetical protein [Mesoflavibacter]|uniref:hypothetical protein n=1 Tax=Mesoflavibacter TaxID=444051 RepID=UPI0026F128CC|nr:hypothetical protein [Mesoflavibacter zeaxanthinifaciens]MCP4052022.1 hypothetical protein [Mesoflavibacter sp.]